MIISEVRALKNGRFGLFAGETFLFSLDADTYASCGIHAGDELDVGALEKLRAEAETQKAREKALLLLSYRDHSKEELRRKLLRSADGEAADAAADRMEELGLIDDAAYARRLAEELLQVRHYGRQRAVFEMLKKGIDRETVLGAVDAFDGDPPARALKLLQKKYPRGIADEAARRRASAMLQRCGYTWEDIRQALNNYGMDEQDAD